MSFNNYVYLKENCLKAFEKFKTEVLEGREITFVSTVENEEERIGFYYFAIEKLTGYTNYKIIDRMICDTNYLKEVHDITSEDNGIDAICIDEENHSISLFNFKYKVYSEDSGQKEGELRASETFLNMIKNDNIDSIAEPQLRMAKKIISVLNNTEGPRWSYSLYFVSNEEKVLNANNPIHLAAIRERFQKDYCFELKLVALQNLPKICGFGHKKVDAQFITLEDNFIELKSGDTPSYIFTVPIKDLLKITCNNKETRMCENLDNSSLSSLSINKDSLYENVRGFVVNSKYNDEISKTIGSEHPEEFFLYNNGVTMIVSNIDSSEERGMKQRVIKLSNIQVVNGGQTLRTLFNFAKEGNNLEHLSRSTILLRIFQVEPQIGDTINNLGNNIARFTNSQNAIDEIDLKSLDQIQFEIEQILNLYGIGYKRKRGKVEDENEASFLYSISSLNLGQILWSIKGFPHKISNGRKQLFGKAYDGVFKNDVEYTKIPIYVLKFFELKDDDNLRAINGNKMPSNQEIFYLLYSIFNFPIESVAETYLELKALYREFKTEETTCDRPYIKFRFFEQWENKLKNKYFPQEEEEDIFDDIFGAI